MITMKRDIKFRGQDKQGNIYYGNLVYIKDTPYIFVPKEDSYTLHEVTHKSISQYAGKDDTGKEIYEGDYVIKYDSEEEYTECPENGKICKVELCSTPQVYPLDSYYCIFHKQEY